MASKHECPHSLRHNQLMPPQKGRVTVYTCCPTTHPLQLRPHRRQQRRCLEEQEAYFILSFYCIITHLKTDVLYLLYRLRNLSMVLAFVNLQILDEAKDVPAHCYLLKIPLQLLFPLITSVTDNSRWCSCRFNCLYYRGICFLLF